MAFRYRHIVGTSFVAGQRLRGYLSATLFVVLSITACAVFSPAAVAELYRPAPDAVVDSSVSSDSLARLERVVELVEASRVPDLIGLEHWRELLTLHRPSIERASSRAQFAGAVNAMLKAAGVSHFHYFISDDWLYWHLASTFEEDGPETRIAHIGLFPQLIGGRWFVRGILKGSVADETDIRVGDELLTVDSEPFTPIRSFKGKGGTSVRVRLQRRPGLIYVVDVTPVKESLHDALQRAVSLSIRTVEHGGFRYAYLHGWTLLGDAREYWKLLDMQDDVDGLLLDYRDGIGGFAGRGRGFLFGPLGEHRHWTKPVVFLIGDGTRSAKELLVNEAQKGGRAALVGTPTPGHVTTVGGVRRVDEESLLMLPGRRTKLEGHPTQPDFRVERDIRFCGGADPQLERAQAVLVDRIRASLAAESADPANEPAADSLESTHHH